MREIFTIEEVNLICIFDISSRKRLISGLTAAMPDFDEPELTEIAVGVLDKLSKMNDADFTALIFEPEYEDYED